MPTTQDEVLAAWALLLPAESCTLGAERQPGDACAPEFVVRAAVRLGTSCPLIRLSDQGDASAMSERPNPARDDIKVRVCETYVDPRKSDHATFVNSGKKLFWPALARNDALSRVVVIGDTGCRNEAGQVGCDTRGGRDKAIGRAWSFARVAEAAAATKPGLVIHVGDFRYRHESAPDSWEDWQKDVFEPAAPLLEAAPWVVARGNHDLCYLTKNGYKGNGWPLFFGMRRGDNPKNCREIARDREIAGSKATRPPVLPPYALDIGERLRLVVLDSSTSYYECEAWGRDFDDWMTWKLDDLLRPADHKADPSKGQARPKDIWLVTHYPVWHIEEKPDVTCGDGKPGHDVRRTKLGSLLLNAGGRVGAVLAGDIHHFEVLQAVGADGAQMGPTEYVAGHGGAWSSPLPTTPELACDPSRPSIYNILDDLPPKENQPAALRGRVICGNGFLGVERRERRWRFTAEFLDASASPPALFSIPAELKEPPAKPRLVVTGQFDADVSRLRPGELNGWRVVGGTDGADVGKIAMLACGRDDRDVEAVVAFEGPPSYAAVPISALRRVGDDAVAVLGRTGDQIKTDFKPPNEVTTSSADQSVGELGEACKGS